VIEQELQGTILDKDERRMQEIIERLKQKRSQGSPQISSGILSAEIIRQVFCNKHDLVIMIEDKKGGFKERFFGSPSIHLTRKCPCPVWIVKSTMRKDYKRIMVIVDLSAPESHKDTFNIKIMEAAISLAKIYQSELHVVYAWTLFAETQLRLTGRASQHEMTLYTCKIEKENESLMKSFLSNLNLEGLCCRPFLFKGDTIDAISDLAEMNKVDLIIMESVIQSRCINLFIANPAEEVLRKERCSVLIFKSDKLLSSVKC